MRNASFRVFAANTGGAGGGAAAAGGAGVTPSLASAAVVAWVAVVVAASGVVAGAASAPAPVADGGGGGTLGGWLGGNDAVVSVATRQQSVHSSPRGDRLGGAMVAAAVIQPSTHGHNDSTDSHTIGSNAYRGAQNLSTDTFATPNGNLDPNGPRTQ